MTPGRHVMAPTRENIHYQPVRKRRQTKTLITTALIVIPLVFFTLVIIFSTKDDKELIQENTVSSEQKRLERQSVFPLPPPLLPNPDRGIAAPHKVLKLDDHPLLLNPDVGLQGSP